MAAFADPAKVEEYKAEKKATFDAADSNSNGFLNKAEFWDHHQKSVANGKAKGFTSPDHSEEEINNWFDKMVEWTGESQGVTFAQMAAFEEQVMKAIMARGDAGQ